MCSFTEKGMLRTLREAGEETVKQEEDPAVTGEDTRGRVPSDTGSVVLIQPQGAHGKLNILHATHWSYKKIPISRPQKALPTITHRP